MTSSRSAQRDVIVIGGGPAANSILVRLGIWSFTGFATLFPIIVAALF